MSKQEIDSNHALAWAKGAFEKVIQEASDLGLIDSPLVESRLSWTMPFEFVIGQLRDQGNQTEFLWVIGGSVPMDCIHSGAAPTPRDAVRHFALKWQIDATRLDDTQASTLVENAEYLYALAADDRFWS